MINATASKAQSPSIEIVEKPKRWRFSVADKVGTIRAADACAPGTVGAYLRREGIYSSQLCAWQRERERGDLDTEALRKRMKAREAERELTARNIQLERDNRKLQRKIVVASRDVCRSTELSEVV